MHKYAHFEHVLHFSGLTYGRHRVQGVKTGGLQPEFAFHQIVSKTPPFITNSTRLFVLLNFHFVHPSVISSLFRSTFVEDTQPQLTCNHPHLTPSSLSLSQLASTNFRLLALPYQHLALIGPIRTRETPRDCPHFGSIIPNLERSTAPSLAG